MKGRGMSYAKKFFKKHQASGCFILTCLISWASLFILLGPDGFFGRVPAAGEQLPFMLLAMYSGPLAGGILMTLIARGKSGLRKVFSGLLRWRANILWYLIALLSAPVLTLAAHLLLSLFSPDFLPDAGFLFESFSSGNIGTLILAGLFIGLLTGFCEELGWTGCATPGLLPRFGILRSGIIIGMVWGFWHFPLFLEKDPAGAVPYVLLVAVRLFTHLPAFRVLMVWVYSRSGSLLVAVLMHAGLTASAMLIQPRSASEINGVAVNIGFTALLWIFVAVVTAAEKKRFFRRTRGFAYHEN